MQNYSLVGDERLEIGDLLCAVQFCLYKINSLFEVEKIVVVKATFHDLPVFILFILIFAFCSSNI
jgi:hypothetical protein